MQLPRTAAALVWLPPPPPLPLGATAKAEPTDAARIHLFLACPKPLQGYAMPSHTVATVIRQLLSGTPAQQQQAAAAANRLVSSSDSQRQAFLESGGTEALAFLLCNSPSDALKKAACAAVSSLFRGIAPDRSRGIAATLVAARAAPPFVRLAESAVNRRDGGLLSDILVALLRVACAEPYCSSALAEAGAATALLEVLRQRRLPVPIHASATLTLQSLSGCGEAACAAISQGGGAAVIVEALRGTLSGVGSSGSNMAGSAIDDELQLGAAATLMHLSDWPEGVTAVLAAGGVPVLVRCLAQGNTEAQEPAVEALLGLMLQRQDQLPAFAAAGGIPAALRVLHGSGDLAVSLPAARQLAVVCDRAPALREAVRAAGGVQAMQRLLQSCGDADVQEAARIALNRLTGGR